MKKKTNKGWNNKVILGLVLAGIFLISISGAYFLGKMNMETGQNSLDSEISSNHDELSIVGEVNSIKQDLKDGDKYNCCLSEDSCTHCLMKHGDCDCLEDMMNGEEVCGECLGEWIEGEGHACPMMAAGFHEAYPEIWEIIEDKYIGKPLGTCPMMG